MATIDDSFATDSSEIRVSAVPDESPTIRYDESHPPLDKGKDTLSREQLLSEQSKDPAVVQLRKRALPFEEADKVVYCFYVKDDILMRKCGVSFTR